MARSPKDSKALTKASATVEAEIVRGGPYTFRVAVDHPADDHDVLPVSAHFGPAFNSGYADIAAQVLGVDPAEIDLYDEACKCLASAQAAFPPAEGYTHHIEVLTPKDDGETHEWNRVR